MPVWKYARDKQVTDEEVQAVMSSLICFKCGKAYHTEDCPFAKLRGELKSLQTTTGTGGREA